MSNRSSKNTSPSNSPKPTDNRARLEASQTFSSSATSEDFAEPPQATAEQLASTPVIIVTDSSSRTPTPNPTQQDRSLVVSSPSQPLRDQHSSTPDERTAYSAVTPRTISISTTPAMSSASSSPGNTSTAGASAGSSNPSYQLPYAPFPYPMPANARGSGQQQSSGQGK